MSKPPQSVKPGTGPTGEPLTPDFTAKDYSIFFLAGALCCTLWVSFLDPGPTTIALAYLNPLTDHGYLASPSSRAQNPKLYISKTLTS